MASAMDLSGRVAIVAGGSRGIGLDLAHGLHDAGARISIWSRDPEAVEVAARSVDGHGVSCDVRKRSAIEAALTSTVDQFAKVDILVVSSGIGSALKPFFELADEEWANVIETNLSGTFRMIQIVARQMADQNLGGKIIVVSSIRATMGAPLTGDYAASKGGVESLVRSAATALAPFAIQVNAIRPGWIMTEMTRNMWSNPETLSKTQGQIPAGRLGRPSDLVGIVQYLASSASDYHSGDVITVDGGLTAGSGGR
jgi:NAD(P)-dependent dehydrogenase (short-subunit alcohol dehydrogenase family)